METASKRTTITVETTINAPVEKVWKFWSEPEHITQWCAASNDWHAPYAKNDLQVGGRFKTTMAAKDGSASFDFEGAYDEVNVNKGIEYTMDDGRKVKVTFLVSEDKTKVIETFEAEETNPIDMQRGGWQAILDNFKNHVETH